MPNLLVKNVRKMKDASKGNMRSIYRKMVGGNGTLGARLLPTQSGNNDAKIGGRVDNGERITQDSQPYKLYKYQLNKNAEDPSLRKLANQNPHKVYVTVKVPIVPEALNGTPEGDKKLEEIGAKFWEDLEKGAEENGEEGETKGNIKDNKGGKGKK